MKRWIVVLGWLGLGVWTLVRTPAVRPEATEARKEPGQVSAALPALPAEPAQRQPDGFDLERRWSGHDDWEPAIAVDPNSGVIYQMTTRYNGPQPCPDCPLPALIFRRSLDGGATWEPDQFLAQSWRSQNDPQVAVDQNGVVHVAWLHDYIPGVTYQQSSDGGQSWSAPILIALQDDQPPQWSDKPVLIISPDGMDVYVAFNARASYVAASHDGGQSFAPPVRTSSVLRYWFHSGGAVAADGTVYVAAASFTSDYTGNSRLYVLRSTDGGISWAQKLVDVSAEMPPCDWAEGCYLGFFGPSMGLAVDSAGTVLIAYHAGSIASAPQQLYIRTSTDGGLTWSDRQQISSEDTAVNNAFPAVAAGPLPGDFRVVWQDDRIRSLTGWNTWYRRTTDGGQTWSLPVRLSNRPFGAPYKDWAGYTFPYGDYLELEVGSDGLNYVIWGAGGSYTGPGGTWYTRGLETE
ncbi:MAG: hypothetical protein Fur0021_04190 [Candidatus Promineifilaceae bacterium]